MEVPAPSKKRKSKEQSRNTTNKRPMELNGKASPKNSGNATLPNKNVQKSVTPQNFQRPRIQDNLTTKNKGLTKTESESTDIIDQIFNKAKKNKDMEIVWEQVGAQKQKKAKDTKGEVKKTILNKPSTNRKNIDGITVYSAEELCIGKGGDTPLCPFDCDCCF